MHPFWKRLLVKLSLSIKQRRAQEENMLLSIVCTEKVKQSLGNSIVYIEFDSHLVFVVVFLNEITTITFLTEALIERCR